MAFNFEEVGNKFCVIRDSKQYPKDKPVFVSDDMDDVGEEGFFTTLKLKTGYFQQVPNPDTEREILYITGASGSGKSWYTKEYIKCYKKLRKKNDIYVFSALKEDETLDEVKDLKRVMVDEDLVDDQIDIEDLHNSLVIFDDIDVISKKKVREEVYNILNQCLEIGRHGRISIIITQHLPTNGQYTRRILNECHYLIYFPWSGASRQLRYLLTEYIGLDRHIIKKNKMMRSRWVCIHKNFPMFIFGQKEAYMLANDDDDEPKLKKGRGTVEEAEEA
jgi:hypothetical protein